MEYDNRPYIEVGDKAEARPIQAAWESLLTEDHTHLRCGDFLEVLQVDFDEAIFMLDRFAQALPEDRRPFSIVGLAGLVDWGDDPVNLVHREKFLANLQIWEEDRNY
jgi:hypothetical protein